MGAVIQFFDRLTNIMSGKGTTVDRRTYNAYAFMVATPDQAEAWYRGTWLGRKIVDIPPFDMTREGRDWQTSKDNIEKLEAEERRLQLWAKLQRALILARLFGGGGIVLGDGAANPMEPLKPDAVRQGGLQYAQVYSRYQLIEGEQRLDPADPWFGQPDFFSINTGRGEQVKLHPSRVVPFIGQRAPEGTFLSGVSWYWGDPILQSIKQAVENADLAQDGFAALIDEAKLDILKIPGLTANAATAEFEQRLTARLAAAKTGQSVWRAKILDSEEEWDQFQVTWAGMPELMFAFMNAVAGAADIPLTRLLGVSPKGLQSSGDGEERDYQTMVKARQNEMLAPALERIDDVLIRSALGSRPSDVYYEFAPLNQVTEQDAAEIEAKRATTVKTYADTGLIPEAALAAMAKNSIVESGRWPGSEQAFEEAAAAGDDQPDPNESDLTTIEQRVKAMEQKGTVTAVDAAILLTDAPARPLYVSRKLLNAEDVIKWAKSQGFATTLPAEDMHVTIIFSREPVDWMSFGNPWDEDDEGRVRVRPGGARLLEQFGNLKTATVLLFNCSQFSWRHADMCRMGASHDFDEYQPHVTLTYEAPADLDLSKVEPYRGELLFGPEIFAEIDDDWASKATEDERPGL
jgi:phage-related protein (TIGR01555 family)